MNYQNSLALKVLQQLDQTAFSGSFHALRFEKVRLIGLWAPSATGLQSVVQSGAMTAMSVVHAIWQLLQARAYGTILTVCGVVLPNAQLVMRW